MSFRLRQRGKDAGKTTSLHFLVPHATSEPSSRRTRGAINAGPSMQMKDRAKPSLKVQSVDTSEKGNVLKPAFKVTAEQRHAGCSHQGEHFLIAPRPLKNYPVAGGNIENSLEIVF